MVATEAITIDEAYAVCQAMAKAHYENFPVASILLPAPMRKHIAAVYAFARTADDIADEGDAPAAERLAALDDWEAKLSSPSNHPVFVALRASIETCTLDEQLLRDLVSAFRQDVTTKTYETWAELLDYCRRSANPVGRLVLAIAGYRSDLLDEQSDAVCTALQLTNFWQDVAEDRAKGRDYLPSELVAVFGAGARREAARRTRELFQRGRPVADAVSGRLKWELRATWLGGARILDRLDRANCDTSIARPRLGAADAVAIGWRMLTW